MMVTAKNLMALLVLSLILQACEVPFPKEEKQQSKKQKTRKKSKKKAKKSNNQTAKKTEPQKAEAPTLPKRLNESPIKQQEYDETAADLSEYLTTEKSELSYAQQAMLNEINKLRRKGCTCNGQYFPPTKPLTVNHKLIRTASYHASHMYQKKRLSHTGHYGLSVDVRLKNEGYSYREASQNITAISASAKEALAYMMRNPKNCANMMRPDFKDVGIGNSGNFWSQVFAKPKQIAAPIPTFYKPQTVSYSKNLTFQKEMLKAVNALRAKGCYCGNTYYPPVSSLRWNKQLERSSYYHSHDMARQGKLSHRGSNGSKLADRVTKAGYDYRSTGENVSYRKHSIQAAVDSWKSSPGHCVNIMRSEFTEIGAAEYKNYWTQNFGSK